jgi:hypothetical protein
MADPAGIAIACLDQGGPLPPYSVLGCSYITASLHMAARPLTSPLRLPWTSEPGPAVSRAGLGRPFAVVMEVACASALVMCPCGSMYPGRQ